VPVSSLVHLKKRKTINKKLYVDVDETLVFWEDPLRPYIGNYTVNTDLVEVLRKVIDLGKYDVSIWSGGGKEWARRISKLLFSEYDLEFFSKYTTWYKNIPEGTLAIDDRLQEDRLYLQKFSKVFSPSEFIKENQCFL
jgi:hypothetical protein